MLFSRFETLPQLSDSKKHSEPLVLKSTNIPYLFWYHHKGERTLEFDVVNKEDMAERNLNLQYRCSLLYTQNHFEIFRIMVKAGSKTSKHLKDLCDMLSLPVGPIHGSDGSVRSN